MTVMLTSSFINSIPISDPNAYVVALNEDGLVVGSQLVFDRTQATIAIWGDDSDTPEKDGASFGEIITFQLVNGSDLYTLNLNDAISYANNGMSILNAVTFSLCGGEVNPTLCEYPGLFSGNTGNSMTLMLTNEFIESLSITTESAYVSASSNGVLVGSVAVYGLNQITLSIWGDDSTTPEIDGASSGAAIELEFVDGPILYSLNLEPITYVVNQFTALYSPSSVVPVCGLNVVEGCTSSAAVNYDSSANSDDGSCITLVNGCTDAAAFNYNALANTNDGSCIEVVLGCTEASAYNYNAVANTNDNSCVSVVNGCTDASCLQLQCACKYR